MPKTKEEEKKDKAVLIILPIGIVAGLAWYFLTRRVAADPNKAILFGAVTDAETEAGIQGVDVNCGGYTGKTGAGGNYEIINIPPGTYPVTFTHPSYYPVEV